MVISRRSFAQRIAVFMGTSFSSRSLWSSVAKTAGVQSVGSRPGEVPRIVVEDFSKKFYPAYLSNGLIGIRPGSSPLAAATTMVNGFVCPNSTHGDVSLSPAPYPLATDFRVNDVSLLKHPELTKIQRQTLDMAKGELLTEIVFTPASGVALRLTVLQFASRSVPSLLCQAITFSTSPEAHVELSAAIESAEFTARGRQRGPRSTLRLATSVRGASANWVLLWRSLPQAISIVSANR